MEVTIISSCAYQTMSSLQLLKRYLMNICFQNVRTSRSDGGSRLRPMKRNHRNPRTKSPLLYFSLMTMRSHIVLPKTFLLKRTRARRETSHLLHHRLNYLYSVLHADRRRVVCIALCCRNLLRLKDLARVLRDDLGESGKYQFAKGMSMVNHDTLQTFSRT